MQAFILMILSILSVMMLIVITRELYHLQPGVNVELRRLEEMIGLEILILTSMAIVIKFV